MKKLISLLLLAALLLSGCASRVPDPGQELENPTHQDTQHSQEPFAEERREPQQTDPPDQDPAESAEIQPEQDPAQAEKVSPPAAKPKDGQPSPVDIPQDDHKKEPEPQPESAVAPVTGVSLSPSVLNLHVGEARALTANISPKTASDKGVTWSSSKPAVAAVNSTGLVTAKGNGIATITVRTEDGGFTATAQVTVTTLVTGVTLNKADLSLQPGQTFQLLAAIHPASASEKGVTWSSSKPEVAAVNSAGLVTAKGLGTAVITVTTKDGGKKAKATVTVTEPQHGATEDELLMLNLVNEERKAAGLQPLKLNLELTEVARLKSQDMIDNNYFAHDSPTYGSPFEMMRQFGISYRTAGENLAMHPSVHSAHQGLMNSPGHRANILNPSFTEIGIGIRRKGNGQYYITQMFIG